jgi:hypothetical protein
MSMNMPEPFAIFDCSLVRCPIGRSCANLRELRDALQTVPDAVLEHHMMRCVLEDHFAMHEFPNDLARWCWSALGDQVLAEHLGVVDPYHHTAVGDLRARLMEVIEDRLWELDRIPWCRPGLELHLIQSRLVIYDTCERAPTPMALFEAIERVSSRSLFYHVHEARRRSGGRTDDFSQWLENWGADAALVECIRKIDFYFLNLGQLREELRTTFRTHLMAPTETRGAIR